MGRNWTWSEMPIGSTARRTDFKTQQLRYANAEMAISLTAATDVWFHIKLPECLNSHLNSIPWHGRHFNLCWLPRNNRFPFLPGSWFSDSELQVTSYNFMMLRKEQVLPTALLSHPHISFCSRRIFENAEIFSNTALDIYYKNDLIFKLSIHWHWTIYSTTQHPACSLLLLPLKEFDDRSKVKELMI